MYAYPAEINANKVDAGCPDGLPLKNFPHADRQLAESYRYRRNRSSLTLAAVLCKIQMHRCLWFSH